jgi:hypothetical protein
VTTVSGYARVRVYLTAHGVEVLNDRDRHLADALGGRSTLVRDLRKRIASRKAGDAYETELYTLMHEFGPGLVVGCMLPFHDVEIDPPVVVDHERALKRRMYTTRGEQ